MERPKEAEGKGYWDEKKTRNDRVNLSEEIKFEKKVNKVHIFQFNDCIMYLLFSTIVK